MTTTRDEEAQYPAGSIPDTAAARRRPARRSHAPDAAQPTLF